MTNTHTLYNSHRKTKRDKENKQRKNKIHTIQHFYELFPILWMFSDLFIMNHTYFHENVSHLFYSTINLPCVVTHQLLFPDCWIIDFAVDKKQQAFFGKCMELFHTTMRWWLRLRLWTMTTLERASERGAKRYVSRERESPYTPLICCTPKYFHSWFTITFNCARFIDPQQGWKNRTYFSYATFRCFDGGYLNFHLFHTLCFILHERIGYNLKFKYRNFYVFFY